MGPLLGVHYVWCAKLVDRLIQCIDAILSLQRVQDAPSQHLACVPVHDRDQIQKAPPLGQIRDVGTPDLMGPVHAQPTQQVRVNLVPLRGLAELGF